MRAVALVLLAAACGDDGVHHLADAPPGIADAAPDAFACPAQQCGDVCVDTDTDPQNCGACGHVCGCGSTTCTAGRCDAHVLADAQASPVALAYDPATNTLYWGTDGDRKLQQLALPDGTATTLYPERTAIRGFAFDATRIYFSRTNFNIMESGTLAGDSSGNFSNAQESGAWGVATDGTNVYWATSGSGNLRAKPNGAPSSGATTLASGRTAPRAVAVDATYLYWTEGAADGAVMRVPKAGGVAAPFASDQPNPIALAIDSTRLYWAVQGIEPSSGAVLSMDLATGNFGTVANGEPAPSAIALDATSVYWTDVSGQILRAPLTGGAVPVVLASGESAPQGIAVANGCVYWAASGSVRSHDITP